MANKLVSCTSRPTYFKGKLSYLAAGTSHSVDWPELLPLNPRPWVPGFPFWRVSECFLQQVIIKYPQGHQLRPACILIILICEYACSPTPAHSSSQSHLNTGRVSRLASQPKWQFPRSSSAIDDWSTCTYGRPSPCNTLLSSRSTFCHTSNRS